MKKYLLILGLTATFGLFAQGTHRCASNECSSCSYASSCDCSPCNCNPCECNSCTPACGSSCGCSYSNSSCCEPCCTPKPPKCIDCECYTPQYYDLQCAWGISLQADFLYWYARETDLAYAQKFEMVETITSAASNSYSSFPQEYKYLDTKWKPGVRVGVGFNSSCDGWDSSVVWTYYKNKSSSSTTVPFLSDQITPVGGQQALVNPWINTTFVIQPVIEKVSASWKLSFNQIDLDLGRKYWLSRCFTLRPYTAVRGMWTKTNFETTSLINPRDVATTPNPTTNVSFNFKDEFKNTYWGVGFLGGLEPSWYFCRTFLIYGDIDAALVWGSFKARKQERYLVTEDTVPSVNRIPVNNTASGDNFSRMLAMLDLGIGLRWEDTYCSNRYRFTLDLGWEHHVLFNYGLLHKNTGATDLNGITVGTEIQNLRYSSGFTRERTDIQMGGLIARVKFDF